MPRICMIINKKLISWHQYIVMHKIMVFSAAVWCLAVELICKCNNLQLNILSVVSDKQLVLFSVQMRRRNTTRFVIFERMRRGARCWTSNCTLDITYYCCQQSRREQEMKSLPCERRLTANGHKHTWKRRIYLNYVFSLKAIHRFRFYRLGLAFNRNQLNAPAYLDY